MNRYFLSLASAAALVLTLSQPVAAQDEKDNEKGKDKLKQYDEIIIRKKTDKDGKVTVEIKDGAVIVNGKPLEDYDDDNLSVRKRKSGAVLSFGDARSPFRSNGGAWNFNSDDHAFNMPDSKTPFLGVATGESKNGATVEEVTKGSAAEKAGLKKGDVITKIDNEAVFSQEDVSKEVKKHKPADKITITFKRDGKEDKTTATLGKFPGNIAFNGDHEAFVMPRIQSMPNFNFDFDNGDNFRGLAMNGKPRLGIKAQDTEDGKGVKVIDVDDESAANKAGIKEDDIITEFNGKTVNSADELAAAARDAREKPSVNVKLTRDGKTQSVELKTPRKLKTANL
jgi:serine protease Do